MCHSRKVAEVVQTGMEEGYDLFCHSIISKVKFLYGDVISTKAGLIVGRSS